MFKQNRELARYSLLMQLKLSQTRISSMICWNSLLCFYGQGLPKLFCGRFWSLGCPRRPRFFTVYSGHRQLWGEIRRDVDYAALHPSWHAVILCLKHPGFFPSCKG
ncbi:hypothetical protein AALO_G00063670 [Alosa alosa]|uniref:Uncharacterized protein n=1 Tax=Alosa alosa TaxID=278164 RepID=A0AAV6H123_9TELE|nr:hypothetical protein AALO_G00063670 [Alosa alosa]